MSKYNMDMSKEDAGQETFNEGWYVWEVVSMDEQTSKNGNKMFKVSVVLTDNPTKGLIFYAIATEGKRWFLKNLLNAVGCDGWQDGVYIWSTEDVIGKKFSGRIQNQQESWTREGKVRESTKSKIVEFASLTTGAPEDDPFAQ